MRTYSIYHSPRAAPSLIATWVYFRGFAFDNDDNANTMTDVCVGRASVRSSAVGTMGVSYALSSDLSRGVSYKSSGKKRGAFGRRPIIDPYLLPPRCLLGERDAVLYRMGMTPPRRGVQRGIRTA